MFLASVPVEIWGQGTARVCSRHRVALARSSNAVAPEEVLKSGAAAKDGSLLQAGRHVGMPDVGSCLDWPIRLVGYSMAVRGPSSFAVP